MLTLGYPMLPGVVARHADRHFDLDRVQRERIDELLAQFLDWHSRHELPELARALEAVSDRARQRVSGLQVAQWRTVLEERWVATAHRLAPSAAEMALSLRPQQIETLKKRFERSNAEARQRFMARDPEARLAARLERITERAEYFFGDLNDAQRAEIARLGARLPLREEVWFEERLARQQRVVGVLERIQREQPARATATRWIRVLLTGYWRSDDALRAEAIARAARETDLLTAALINAAAPEGRRRAAERLQGWASDFVRLAAAARGG